MYLGHLADKHQPIAHCLTHDRLDGLHRRKQRLLDGAPAVRPAEDQRFTRPMPDLPNRDALPAERGDRTGVQVERLGRLPLGEGCGVLGGLLRGGCGGSGELLGGLFGLVGLFELREGLRGVVLGEAREVAEVSSPSRCICSPCVTHILATSSTPSSSLSPSACSGACT